MTLESRSPVALPGSLARVGLVVHYSTSNYGNHLVNLAVRRTLEACGHDVELIVFEGGAKQLAAARRRRMAKKLVRLIRSRELGDRVRRRFIRVTPPTPLQSEARRIQRFQEFSDQHLMPTFHQAGKRHELVHHFSHFVMGSDQVWNYDYGLAPWHFLDFADPSACTFVGPSVGHAAIPLEWRKFYAAHLAGHRDVGVREIDWTAGLPELEPEERFTLVPDPTLVVLPDEWRALARVPEGYVGGVLLYELGEATDRQIGFVQEIASQHHLRVNHLSANVGGRLWDTDAAEFLGMISAAECVVTDSYHGAIFAFLFDRPLVLLRRHGFAGAMNSRIDNLVAQLNLEDRQIDRLSPETAVIHDYAAGYQDLAEFRASFWAYLARHGHVRINQEES